MQPELGRSPPCKSLRCAERGKQARESKAMNNRLLKSSQGESAYAGEEESA